MKRFVMLLIMITLSVSIVSAEENPLGSYTFDELIEINKIIIQEIITRPEWKEVKVPAGEYVVGEDIPAGSYTILSAKYISAIGIYKDKNKNDIDYNYYIVQANGSIGKLTLKDGMVITITSDVIFTPYIGLGF